MPKPATKKKCANPNCSNPKCPFPHYANETVESEPVPPKKKIEATYLPYSNVEILTLERKKLPKDHSRTPTDNPSRNPTSALIRVCRNCRQSFGITVGEQEWYAKKSFSLPKRCYDCRQVCSA
jgi:hypothetical protein